MAKLHVHSAELQIPASESSFLSVCHCLFKKKFLQLCAKNLFLLFPFHLLFGFALENTQSMLCRVSLGCTPVKSVSSIGLFSWNGLILEKLQASENRFHNKYQAAGNRPGTGLCCGIVETPFWVQEQETGWFESGLPSPSIPGTFLVLFWKEPSLKTGDGCLMLHPLPL